VDAKNRGVKIQIIGPGPVMDSKTVQAASRANWGKLLEVGIEIYEYQPTMYHCKFMIVDSQWTSVGSTNFDSRSFKLNSESNLNIIDPEFAQEQSDIFAKDQEESKKYTWEIWKVRPLAKRFSSS
jgi:cardiolipin synthase